MFSYELSPSEYDGFTKTTLVDEYLLPSESLGQFATQGAQFQGFKLTAEDRDMLLVTYLPEGMSHVVNQDEAEQTIAGAVVHSRAAEKVWYLPYEVVDDSPFLPELRQAFHEGFGYDEREANYRYHFPEGETAIAVPSANPLERPDEQYTVTAIEYLGGHFPRKFLLETEGGDYLYLRERAGQIRVRDDYGNGEEIVNIYVGREHPGMNFSDDELFNIISAFDYIDIVEDYETGVPEEAKEEYWGDFDDSIYSSNELDDEDLEELFEIDMDEDEAEDWADAQPDEPHPSEEDADEEN